MMSDAARPDKQVPEVPTRSRTGTEEHQPEPAFRRGTAHFEPVHAPESRRRASIVRRPQPIPPRTLTTPPKRAANQGAWGITRLVGGEFEVIAPFLCLGKPRRSRSGHTYNLIVTPLGAFMYFGSITRFTSVDAIGRVMRFRCHRFRSDWWINSPIRLLADEELVP